MNIHKIQKVSFLGLLMAAFALPPSPVLAETSYQGTVYKGVVSVHPNTVRLAGDEVFTIQAPAGGFTAEERALIVERNVNNALLSAINPTPDSVEIVPINNLPVIRIAGKHVVTVESRSAQMAGTTMTALAQTWSDNMRRALADKAKVDTYLASLSGDFIPTIAAPPYRRARLEAANHNHAATEFLSMVPIDLKSSDSYEDKGFTNMLDRDFCAAAENFKKALILDNQNARAHYGLGVAMLKQGQVDAAVKSLDMSRWLEPDNALTHIALGQAFETQGRDTLAVKRFQEAILLQPDNPEPYLAIADLREERNDIGRSVAELTEGLKVVPNSQYMFLKRKDQLTWRLIRPY